MERYDIAVIGTGPAGLEAAITAKIRNKNILLLGGNNLSSKVEKAHTIKNYLGLPDVSGEDMRRAFAEHLDRMDISVTQERVNAVYAMGDYFAIQGHKDMYEASSVILACGMSAAKPFPGELENLGKGVSYCATCDAMLYRGKTAIVIGYSDEDEKEAEFLAEVAKQVYYLPMYRKDNSMKDVSGNDICLKDASGKDISLNDKIRIISGVKPVSIRKSEGRMQLIIEGEISEKSNCDDRAETDAVLEDGTVETKALDADGIFILRQNVAPSQLVPGLAMEENHVAVDRSMKTNIPGLFACGDITGAPYQYIKAAGEGNVAALSAVSFLADKSRS